MTKRLIGVSFGSQPMTFLMPSDAPSNQTNLANKHHHLFIALFAGRAKEIYQRNYNYFHTTNNALPIEDQASDADVLKAIVNETAKSFFDSWDTSIQEQQQYMRQIFSLASQNRRFLSNG
jgi:hypothetical protein